MDVEAVIIELAQKQGELSAYEKMFTAMNGKVEKIDEKLDQLLIREGERVGEIRGIKRSTGIIATLISLIIGATAIAIR